MTRASSGGGFAGARMETAVAAIRNRGRGSCLRQRTRCSGAGGARTTAASDRCRWRCDLRVRDQGGEAVRTTRRCSRPRRPPHDVTDVAADGEVVLVAWELTATFTGAPFHGLRPNASRVRLEGASTHVVREGRAGSEVTCGVDGSVRSGRGRDGQPRPGAGMEGEEGRAARAWSVAVTDVAEHPRVTPRGGSRAAPLGGCVSSRGRPPVGRPPGRCIGRFGRHRCRRWSAAAGSPQRPTRSCQAGQPWTARWPSFCGAG